MPATKKAIEPGTLVTVTITDGTGAEHTFHGTSIATVPLHSQTWEDTSGLRYNYLPADERTISQGHGEPSTWLRVYSATGNPIPGSGGSYGVFNTFGDGALPGQSLDWFFNMYDFHVRIDSDNVDVRVASKAGKAWVDANLSIDNRRQRLLGRLNGLDPALAAEAENLMGAIDTDAYERGKNDEWRANND